jgi:alpha-galactosidase
LKPLEDGSKAVGFFNRDSVPQTIAFDKFRYLGIKNRQQVRDLWRQVNLPDYTNPVRDPFKTTIPAHGVQLYKLTPAQTNTESN